MSTLKMGFHHLINIITVITCCNLEHVLKVQLIMYRYNNTRFIYMVFATKHVRPTHNILLNAMQKSNPKYNITFQLD